MQDDDSNTITVGVDGSDASAQALVWAIREALRDGLDVDVVTAWPAQGAVMVHEVPGHFNDSRGRAVAAQQRVVTQVIAQIEAQVEAARLPRITERIENSRPVEALLDAASTSKMLVVGAGHARRHQFGVASPRLVDRCYDDATCAVAVVGVGGSIHQRQARAQVGRPHVGLQ